MNQPALALVALLALASAAPASATSFASSASSAASESVGSISTSIEGSSKGLSKSSEGDKKVAQGEYRLVDVATVAGQADMARLHLQGQAGEFDLLIPRAVFERAGLASGDTVAVAERAWGLNFTVKGQAEPFFLAVDDSWQGGLNIKPVRL